MPLLLLQARPLNFDIFAPHAIKFPFLGIKLSLLLENGVPVLTQQLFLFGLLVPDFPLEFVVLEFELLQLILQLLDGGGLVVLPELELAVLLLEHGGLQDQVAFLLLQGLYFGVEELLAGLLLLDFAVEFGGPGLLAVQLLGEVLEAELDEAGFVNAHN